MYDLPDHPIIQNMEATGYPDGNPPEEPTCPTCGADEISVIYKEHSEITGCDRCIHIITMDTEEICPICGAACDIFYYNNTDQTVGCSNCISHTDPWEEDECFPKERSKF